jgi:hypothetical protein
MAEPDPIDDPVGAPGGTRSEPPLEFPRQGSAATINVWRVTIYVVLLVIVLAAIVYFSVRPR